MTFSPWVTKARLSVLQTSDVGDGAERDEIEQVDQLRLLAICEKAARREARGQRHAEQERHADRGEMAVRRAVRAFVEPVGIDQRKRGRKQAGAW